MGNYSTFSALFKGIADAIRTKTGTVESIYPSQFASKINGISMITDAATLLISRDIKNYSDDSITTIGNYVFYNCTRLSSVNFPNCTTIGNNVFYNCTKLSTVSFPNCTNIGRDAFHGCTRLSSVDFPNCTAIDMDAFVECTALTTASFPKCITINHRAFSRCTNLVSLYLLGDSIPELVSTTVFSSTPIGGYSTVAGQYGSIYVPSSLLSSYKTASVWTYFSSRFVGV